MRWPRESSASASKFSDQWIIPGARRLVEPDAPGGYKLFPGRRERGRHRMTWILALALSIVQ